MGEFLGGSNLEGSAYIENPVRALSINSRVEGMCSAIYSYCYFALTIPRDFP